MPITPPTGSLFHADQHAARRSANRPPLRTRSPVAVRVPHLLALMQAAKYGQHLPLTRQGAIYGREGVEIDVSSLAALRRR